MAELKKYLNERGLREVWDIINGQNSLIVSKIKDIQKRTTVGLYADSTSGWEENESKISEAGALYIYTDAETFNGKVIAKVKIGDGTSSLADLSFIDAPYSAHIADKDIHLTAEERAKWNDEIGAFVTAAEESANTAGEAASRAETAKTAAETARDTAVSAKERSLAAEANASRFQTEADKSAQNAKDSEQNAAKSAERAEGSRHGADLAVNQAWDYARKAGDSANNAGSAANRAQDFVRDAAGQADRATVAANRSETAAQTAQAVADSLPDDYVTAVGKIAENTAEINNTNTEVSELKEDLGVLENAIGVYSPSVYSEISGESFVEFRVADGINFDGKEYEITIEIETELTKILYYSLKKSDGTTIQSGNIPVGSKSSTFSITSSEQSAYISVQVAVVGVKVNATIAEQGTHTNNVEKNTQDIENISENMNNLMSLVKGILKYSETGNILPSQSLDGYIVNGNGVLEESSLYQTTGLISCADFVYCDYTGYCKWGTQYCAIFTDDGGNVKGKFLQGTSTQVLYENERIDVPNGATKVAFNWLKSGSSSIRIVRYYAEHIGDINDKIGAYKRYTGKKWCCVGDSLTEQNSATSKHYYDYISDELGFNVVNMGVGGTGYMRGYDSNNAFYQRISSCPTDVDVVTIFGSGNDISLMEQIGEYTDNGTSTICGCVNTTLDNFFQICPTTPIGIIAPSPWSTTPTTSVGNNMEQYVIKLKQIAEYRGIPFLDLYHCSNLRPEIQSNRELCFANGVNLDGNGDGVHPNELGHKIIASKIREFVLSLIIN